MTRPFLLWSLLALAACDSAVDLEPAGGVVLVSLGTAADGSPGLVLQTEDAYACGARLVVTDDTVPAGLSVAVEGIALAEGPRCLAPNAPLVATVALPAASPSVDVAVRHRGATDAYQYTCGFAGCDLTAVRTSTTRLSAPAP